MNERKNEHPKRSKNRHQQTAAALFVKQTDRSQHNEQAKRNKEEKPFKGKDIDRLNYTDI